MCITPYSQKDKTNETFPLECGKCPECVKKRASQWSFRLRKEAEVSTSALFVTLTYDTEHVYITPRGYMSLWPIHVTKWLKRLRKISKQKIKYFYVGEYGKKTLRPHYHILIFNAEMEDIEKTWHYGKSHYGELTGASIGYCLKYMIKDGLIPMHKNDDRLPEFARMSQGIGASYVTKKTVEYHIEPRAILERAHLTIDEKKIPMPRYYKDMIYTPRERDMLKHYAKQLQDKKDALREKVDTKAEVEAHKAAFKKMYNSKYKNRKI